MNKGVFYNIIRDYPFPGKLADDQFEGMETILDEWLKRGLTDIRWLAYILGTTYHETAYTMKPVRERGQGRGKKYGTTYYGRGFVQITWDFNYKTLGDVLGVDLLGNPDKALEWDTATQIIFDGMIQGLFAPPHSLGKYFTEDNSDWRNARRIVNGLDRAEEVATYARGFYVALYKATNAQQSERDLVQQISNEPVDSEVREIFREFHGGSFFSN